MKTQLPEPAIPRSQLLPTSKDVFGALFTESQLRAAMVAAYNEAIEDAASIAENWDTPDCGGWTAGDMVDAIRKLKEQS